MFNEASSERAQFLRIVLHFVPSELPEVLKKKKLSKGLENCIMNEKKMASAHHLFTFA